MGGEKQHKQGRENHPAAIELSTLHAPNNTCIKIGSGSTFLRRLRVCVQCCVKSISHWQLNQFGVSKRLLSVLTFQPTRDSGQWSVNFPLSLSLSHLLSEHHFHLRKSCFSCWCHLLLFCIPTSKLMWFGTTWPPENCDRNRSLAPTTGCRETTHCRWVPVIRTNNTKNIIPFRQISN